MPERCGWAAGSREMIAYHDEEWGVPVRDDRLLLEFLVLEGAQAGLSWATILARRPGYRRAFHDFDPVAVSRFGSAKQQALLQDPGIIRNRLKVQSAVTNAAALLRVQAECGSFADYLWAFVDGRPLQPARVSLDDIPTETPESRALSKDLRRRGFSFIGPTICYAFMQAVGMVNDHVVDCFRHAELSGEGGAQPLSDPCHLRPRCQR